MNRSLIRFAPLTTINKIRPSITTNRCVHNTAVGVNSMGQKVDRPISPHVTIYSQPIPAVSSITNRVTGTLLTIGMTGAGILALTGSCDIPASIHAFKSSVPALVPLVKIIVAFPLIYHSLAGIRHLYWDYTAKMLELPAVEISSKILIGVSVVLAIGTAFISLPPLIKS